MREGRLGAKRHRRSPRWQRTLPLDSRAYRALAGLQWRVQLFGRAVEVPGRRVQGAGPVGCSLPGNTLGKVCCGTRGWGSCSQMAGEAGRGHHGRGACHPAVNESLSRANAILRGAPIAGAGWLSELQGVGAHKPRPCASQHMQRAGWCAALGRRPADGAGAHVARGW